jgi:hypothetical protein
MDTKQNKDDATHRRRYRDDNTEPRRPRRTAERSALVAAHMGLRVVLVSREAGRLK